MWICEKCGEPHEDHFKICWKCTSEAMEEHVTAVPPPLPKPEPKLRSTGAILFRMLIGSVLGGILGGAVSIGYPADYQIGLVIYGAIGLAIVTGVFFWVLFPYEPGPTSQMPDGPARHEDSPA